MRACLGRPCRMAAVPCSLSGLMVWLFYVRGTGGATGAVYWEQDQLVGLLGFHLWRASAPSGSFLQMS